MKELLFETIVGFSLETQMKKKKDMMWTRCNISYLLFKMVKKDWINLKFPLVVFIDVIMLIVMLFYNKFKFIVCKFEFHILYLSYFMFNNLNNNWNYQKKIVQLLFISIEYFKMSYEVIIKLISFFSILLYLITFTTKT